MGLIVAVGVAFVPTTITAIQDVREADKARTGGRPIRRGRLIRQIVPVLENGLERAVTLAESMDSRGFARGGAAPREQFAGWCGGAGLLALAGAFVALIGRESEIAVALVIGGGVAMIAAIVIASTASMRVRYRPRRLTRADVAVMAGVFTAPALLVALSVAGDNSLTWVASPLRWPELHPLPALTLIALLTPFVVRPSLFGRIPSSERRETSKPEVGQEVGV